MNFKPIPIGRENFKEIIELKGRSNSSPFSFNHLFKNITDAECFSDKNIGKVDLSLYKIEKPRQKVIHNT